MLQVSRRVRLFSAQFYYSATCRRADRSICVFRFAADSMHAARVLAKDRAPKEGLELIRVTGRGTHRPLSLNIIH
jgi:hypothetical protein